VRGDSVQGRIVFTAKAREELAGFDPPLDDQEARDILAHLMPGEFSGRVRSYGSGEWLYIFQLQVFGVDTYVKLVWRNRCVVISFHEDKGDVE
jgi:hypothetical protein